MCALSRRLVVHLATAFETIRVAGCLSLCPFLSGGLVARGEVWESVVRSSLEFGGNTKPQPRCASLFFPSSGFSNSWLERFVSLLLAGYSAATRGVFVPVRFSVCKSECGAMMRWRLSGPIQS